MQGRGTGTCNEGVTIMDDLQNLSRNLQIQHMCAYFCIRMHNKWLNASFTEEPKGALRQVIQGRSV